jgi:hypothetical protein
VTSYDSVLFFQLHFPLNITLLFEEYDNRKEKRSGKLMEKVTLRRRKRTTNGARKFLLRQISGCEKVNDYDNTRMGRGRRARGTD